MSKIFNTFKNQRGQTIPKTAIIKIKPTRHEKKIEETPLGRDHQHPTNRVCLLDCQLTSKDKCCVLFDAVSLP